MAGQLYDIWWATLANDVDRHCAYVHMQWLVGLTAPVVWYGVMLDDVM